MHKNVWRYLVAGMLLGALLVGSEMPMVFAEKVPVKVINSGGKVRLPEYIQLETTEQAEYYQYTNRRFGFTAYIPAEMDGCFLPHNGDGASFLNEENAGIIVSGMHNVTNRTLEGEYQDALQRHGNVSYKALGEEWFVLSWLDEQHDLIIYEKHFVNAEYLNTLRISYPRVGREYYASMVEIVEANFVPGWRTGKRIMG